MRTKIIDVSMDFSEYPSGIKRSDGDLSGETFREDFLVNEIKQKNIVVVILDDTIGYGASWLKEAFGGLVACNNISLSVLERQLVIIDNRKTYATMAWKYIQEESYIGETENVS